MGNCKWMDDDICTNSGCPAFCGYCPVPKMRGICRYEEDTQQPIMVCKSYERRTMNMAKQKALTEAQRQILLKAGYDPRFYEVMQEYGKSMICRDLRTGVPCVVNKEGPR